MHPAGILPIPFRMAVHEDGLRTKLVGGSQRHGRVNAELPGGVGCCRDDSSLVRTSADYHRFATKRGVIKLFHGDEESVHVHVEEGFHWANLIITNGPLLQEVWQAAPDGSLWRIYALDYPRNSRQVRHYLHV